MIKSHYHVRNIFYLFVEYTTNNPVQSFIYLKQIRGGLVGHRLQNREGPGFISRPDQRVFLARTLIAQLPHLTRVYKLAHVKVYSKKTATATGALYGGQPSTR